MSRPSSGRFGPFPDGLAASSSSVTVAESVDTTAATTTTTATAGAGAGAAVAPAPTSTGSDGSTWTHGCIAAEAVDVCYVKGQCSAWYDGAHEVVLELNREEAFVQHPGQAPPNRTQLCSLPGVMIAQCMRMSLNSRYLAVQVGDADVMVYDIADGARTVSVLQCKSKSSSNFILRDGIIWSYSLEQGVESHDLWLVTKQGLELYQVPQGSRVFKFVRQVAHTIRGFWYVPQERFLVISLGKDGLEFRGFLLYTTGPTKLERLKVRAAPPLTHTGAFTFYNELFLVLVMEFTIDVYQFGEDTVQLVVQLARKHTGAARLSSVNNLLLVHELDSGTTVVYDVRQSAIYDPKQPVDPTQPLCEEPIHVVAKTPRRPVSAAGVSPSGAAEPSPASRDVFASKLRHGALSAADVYSMSTEFLVPNLLMSPYGELFVLVVHLPSLVAIIPHDAAVVDVLLRRSEFVPQTAPKVMEHTRGGVAKSLLIQRLHTMILANAALGQVPKAFDLINSALLASLMAQQTPVVRTGRPSGIPKPPSVPAGAMMLPGTRLLALPTISLGSGSATPHTTTSSSRTSSIASQWLKSFSKSRSPDASSAGSMASHRASGIIWMPSDNVPAIPASLLPPSPTNPYGALVLQPEEMFSLVFEPLVQHVIETHSDDRAVSVDRATAYMLEYLRSLHTNSIPVTHNLHLALVRMLNVCDRTEHLQQLLQYRIVNDSAELATILLEIGTRNKFLAQCALDMCHRLGDFDRIVGSMLDAGMILEAMRQVRARPTSVSKTCTAKFFAATVTAARACSARGEPYHHLFHNLYNFLVAYFPTSVQVVESSFQLRDPSATIPTLEALGIVDVGPIERAPTPSGPPPPPPPPPAMSPPAAAVPPPPRSQSRAMPETEAGLPPSPPFRAGSTTSGGESPVPLLSTTRSQASDDADRELTRAEIRARWMAHAPTEPESDDSSPVTSPSLPPPPLSGKSQSAVAPPLPPRPVTMARAFSDTGPTEGRLVFPVSAPVGSPLANAVDGGFPDDLFPSLDDRRAFKHMFGFCEQH